MSRDAGTPGAEETPAERRGRLQDRRWAVGGAIATSVVGFGGMAIVGTASTFEARRLLESALPSLRFAAAAYVGTGATVLALMLTLTTFSISHDLDFHRRHYRRIREIATVTTMAIISSVLMLLFVSFPLSEADVAPDWYVYVYYALILGGAITGGMFIAVVLMLLHAVRGVISVGENPETSDLVLFDVADAEPEPDGSRQLG